MVCKPNKIVFFCVFCVFIAQITQIPLNLLQSEGPHKIDFIHEFFKDVKKLAEYFSEPRTMYCHTIYCQKPEAERDCDNCKYIPKDAWD